MNYLVFAGSHYYPSGGGNDFVDSFKCLTDALECAKSCVDIKKDPDWAHVFDVEKKEVVKEIYNKHIT